MLPLEARGKAQQGRRSEVKLNLKPQTAQIMAATARPPVAAADAAARPLPAARRRQRDRRRLTGSVFYDLDVPDFTKEKFTMSGVVLTAATARVTPTAEPDDGAQGGAAGAADDPPRVLPDRRAGALRRGLRPLLDRRPHTVDVTTRLVDEQGKEVSRTTDARKSYGVPERDDQGRLLRLHHAGAAGRRAAGPLHAPGRGQGAPEGRAGGAARDADHHRRSRRPTWCGRPPSPVGGGGDAGRLRPTPSPCWGCRRARRRPWHGAERG